MSILSGKNIVLGVTGGIAAYKSSILVRLLVKAGAFVKVVMTPAAREFVTPLTLATLSKNPVEHAFVDEGDDSGTWHNHVDLGLWADLMIIAPATSNTLSKMASGGIDNLLLAVYCSAKCPVYFAPAMDLDMYKHPSTTASFNTLVSYGNTMIPAGDGELASGLSGKGRMAEPEEILAFIENHLKQSLPLHNKKILITAGPTHEPIDPVRFIGNHSSGKMGVALANRAAALGAQVYLIIGPSHVKVTNPLITRIDVTTAQEMYAAVFEHIETMDCGIFSAAVADYRPAIVENQKIKKNESTLTIELVKNPDILASVGKLESRPFLVGFALETENELAHAIEKAQRKNCDLLVLNSMRDTGAGFGKDTNKITIINKDASYTVYDTKSKELVANDILQAIIQNLT